MNNFQNYIDHVSARGDSAKKTHPRRRSKQQKEDIENLKQFEDNPDKRYHKKPKKMMKGGMVKGCNPRKARRGM